jgi:hypothetical protein
MSRRLLLVAALASLLTASLALLWLAAPQLGLPWSPADERALAPAGFEVLAGSGAMADGQLELRGADADGRTLLIHAASGDAAGPFRYLQFEFADLPPTLRPVLVWRGPGGDGSAALPWGRGGGTVDLQRLAGWPPRFDALGLLLVPMDAVPPAAVANRQLAFRGIRLSSANRRDAVAALWTEWFAYRPWTGRSINTGGFELPIERSVRPLAWLAISVAGGLLAAAVAAGRRRRWQPLLFGAVVLLWVLLDLLQLRQLGMRAEAARHTRQSTPSAAPITAQPGLSAPLAALQQRLAGLPAGTRVLVYAEGAFLRQYPVFLLRAHDVAPLPSLAALPADVDSARPVLVLAGQGDWQHDAVNGVLRLGGRDVPAELLLAQPPLAAYRLGRAR